MTAVTVHDSLRHLNALSHFSLEQLKTLAGTSKVLNLPAGATVVSHGDETTDLYGLINGGVAIQRDTPHGEFVLARLKPGELVGETNFIDPDTRSTDVVTTSDSELIRLDSETLRQECEENRRFELALYWAVWNSVSRKLRIATGMLSHFFATHEPGDAPTSVGQPKRGNPYSVDVHTKRDLFLELELSHMEANFLASLSKGERFDANDTIFREGEAGEKLYFILNGKVRISKAIPGTGEEALAILEAGEVFGEMSLVDGRPRTADALAHENVVDLLVIPAAVLARLLDIDKLSSSRLLRMLCRTVARRLRSLDEKIIGWYILSGGESTLIGGPP